MMDGNCNAFRNYIPKTYVRASGCMLYNMENRLNGYTQTTDKVLEMMKI